MIILRRMGKSLAETPFLPNGRETRTKGRVVLASSKDYAIEFRNQLTTSVGRLNARNCAFNLLTRTAAIGRALPVAQRAF